MLPSSLSNKLPKLLFASVLVAGSLFGGALVSAEESEPTAIVEKTSDDRNDIQEFDFLTAGQTVILQAGEALTLVYLASCVQETITGGVVTIGARQSSISGGDVQRVNVVCEDGNMELS